MTRSEETLDEDGDVVEEGAALPSGHDYQHRRLHPLWVCGQCGAIHEESAVSCASCHIAGALVAVQVVRCKEDLPGGLHSCGRPARPPDGDRVAAGIANPHAQCVRSPSRMFTCWPSQCCTCQNDGDYSCLPTTGRMPRFRPGWMRDHARRFRLRALMSHSIPKAGASIGDIAQHLDAGLEQDRELSRALIPEVWQVAPQEDAGVKHREERLYFLRSAGSPRDCHWREAAPRSRALGAPPSRLRRARPRERDHRALG